MRRAVLKVDSSAQVPPAVDEAATFFGHQGFEVWVDDRARAQQLTAALATFGFEPVQDTVVLALVSAVSAGPGPGALVVEDVVDDVGLAEWARVKLQGFADSEAAPTPAALAHEVAARKAEWPVCRYQLGCLNGERVAMLGSYTGIDQMVFLLATRMPFRHLGIAQNLLAEWSRRPVGDPRSLLINCDDGGAPALLYQRIGFTDEIYWHRRYTRAD